VVAKKDQASASAEAAWEFTVEVLENASEGDEKRGVVD